MKTKAILRESSRLAEKSADGTYPVVLITEGIGSTGVYGADAIAASAAVFENAPSFINHPADPQNPGARDLNTIAGRITNVRVGEDAGRTALIGDYKPRKEYEALFEDFGDIIGLSIFCEAFGEKDDTGRLVLESFNGDFPFKSVDAVVAAGRGGRFVVARESLLAIESALGVPEVNQPGSTSAPGSPTPKEKSSMDLSPQDIQALAEALKPSLVEALTPAAPAAPAAPEPATDAQIEEAVEKATKSVEAVKEAKLTPSLEKPLLEAARKGKDVTAGIAEAQAILAEARQGQTPAATPGRPSTFVATESATSGAGTLKPHSYFIPSLGGN